MSDNTTTKRRRRFRPIHLLYGLMAFIILSILGFTIFKPIKVLPRISLAPGYSVVNQDNEPRSSEDFRGKLTLYGFTYSNCDKDCPQDISPMKEMRELLSQFTFEGVDIDFALVTVTLDAERDDPKTLNAFAAPYLGTEDSTVTWDFLTGDPTKIKYMAGGGFGLFYEPEPESSIGDDYEISFYPRYVLVDGWSIIRAEYLSADLDYDLVMEDINYLAGEIAASEGVGKYAYEAAHLFRCYP